MLEFKRCLFTHTICATAFVFFSFSDAAIAQLAYPGYSYESNFVGLPSGHQIHYLDEGPRDAPPVLLLHGVPTSSFLWRDVIPELANDFRVIAPDLVNSGRSSRSAPLTVSQMSEAIGEFVGELGIANLNLGMHDWGIGVGMMYADANQDNINSLAFFEGPFQTIPRVPPELLDFVGAVTSESSVVEGNFFIREFLPKTSAEPLTEQELATYAEPYEEEAVRRQTLQLARQLPFSNTDGHPFHDPDGDGPLPGQPSEEFDLFSSYVEYLADADVPRLLLVGDPALGPGPETLPLYESTIPGLETAVVGDALANPTFHFLQEDAPIALGQELNRFYQSATVPEPSSFGLLVVGLLLAMPRRVKRSLGAKRT